MRYAAISDRGRVREANEDAYWAADFGVAVADGMGGHQAGGLASETALEELDKLLPAPPRRPEKALPKIFDRANKAVLAKARELGREGMGTTLTLALIKDHRAWIAHIGDSRAYLLRQGRLSRITKDHSLVADLVRQGHITEKIAQSHPKRHIITKAVGSQQTIEPDIIALDLQPRDRLILCTDGLSGYVEDDAIAKLAIGTDPQTACRRLVDAANEAGGLDNVTVVVADTDRPTKPPTKKSRLKLTMTVVAFFVVVSLALFAAGHRLSNSFYLTTADGTVAVRQGLPRSIGGYQLNRHYQRTSIESDSLPPYYQRRLAPGLVVGDEKSLRKAIADLKELSGAER
jgi:PPM family protein phosphatase